MNAKKLLLKFRELSADKSSPIGISLLDPLVLLTIATAEGCSKADLYEKIYYSRSKSKSGLDGPVTRLLNAGYIEKKINKNFSNTKKGEGKAFYYLTGDGRKLLK